MLKDSEKQYQCEWKFITSDSRLVNDVSLALVDMETNRSIGQVEINVEVLLCFIEASLSCEDWYRVNDKGYFAEQNKDPVIWELEENGEQLEYHLEGILGEMPHDIRKLFYRQPLVTVKRLVQRAND